MYAKLFSRITESSLMEEPINVRYTFVLMLAIADPEGYVIGTDIAIARRLNMELDEFQRCLETLTAPDPHSNSKVLDGVRLVNSDGERGYKIVNYTTYRDLKSPEDRREYMREYMRERRKSEREHKLQQDVNSVNNGKSKLAQLGQAEAEAEAEAEEKKKGACAPKEKRVVNFVIPSVEDVREYCRERSSTIDPDQFIDHYKSNGWKIGKASMRDWKAAVRTWERLDKERKSGSRKPERQTMAEILKDCQ